MIVVDASIAVKWFLMEPFSDVARAIADEGDVRVAPEHVIAEVGQVLLRAVRTEIVSRDHARESLDLLGKLVQLLPTRDLAIPVFEIAMEIGCTNYDALYVAAARSWSATLVTADARLARQIEKAGRPGMVRLLGA